MAAAAAADWDPALYRRFEDERTRPARDLLARVVVGEARAVYDLGCGPGNSTQVLAERFGPQSVTGVDTSEAMLAAARQRLPACRFVLGDVARFVPEAPPDLLFANALLQWVPDHAALLPRLLASLAPGGALAVQMPDNLAEPSHRLMREVAADGPWAATVGDAGASRAGIMLSLDHYYDLLSPQAARLDLWRTAYQHPLDSPEAIVAWVSATGLKPYVDPLPEAQRRGFLDAYTKAVDAAYPARADGKRLLAFPRLFVVAHKAG